MTAIDPQTMYNYDKKTNIPWNIVQYQPLRDYFDHQKCIQQNKRNNGETTPPKYVTKRGCFIDNQIKYFQHNPAPCKYDTKSIFDQTQNKKQGKKHPIDFKLHKNTYLQQIQKIVKRHKSPSVGHYSLSVMSSPKKAKTHRHKKIDDKRFFYQDSQFLSTCNPGSGAYNPHEEVPNTRKQRFDYKYWIEKHGKQFKRNRQKSLKQPDSGTYTPLHLSFNSFDRIKADEVKRKKKVGKQGKQKQGKSSTHRGFGSSDAKFDYERKHTSKQQKRPDPCNYNTMIQWKGKGQDTKRTWVRCLSAGPRKGVYH